MPPAQALFAPEQDRPEDVAALKLLFTRVLMGMTELFKVARAVELERKRLAAQKDVIPIGRAQVEAVSRQLRPIFARASDMAAQVGIVLPFERMLDEPEVETSGDESFDVGRFAPDRAARMRDDILSGGGIAPGAGIIIMGEEFTLKALAKLGLRKAAAGATSFARLSLKGAVAAARALGKMTARFVTPALMSAATAAVAWLAAGTAVRIAGPGLGLGLGNLLSTPGGMVLAGVIGYALYKSLSRR